MQPGRGVRQLQRGTAVKRREDAVPGNAVAMWFLGSRGKKAGGTPSIAALQAELARLQAECAQLHTKVRTTTWQRSELHCTLFSSTDGRAIECAGCMRSQLAAASLSLQGTLWKWRPVALPLIAPEWELRYVTLQGTTIRYRQPNAWRL